ncbi:MAG TPA: MFS transporter [Actinomycetota bacterium]|nr:MFS transporter [Actinomycetota bacterium]
MSRVPGWLWRILVALVLTQAASFLARPVTSYRALALGADERVIGLITASFAVIPLLVAVPLGRAADRRRPVGMLAGGVVILVASFVLLGLAGSLAELALWSALLGLGHLALILASQSLIAQQSEDRQHDRDFGLMAAAVSLGQLVGPAVGGLVLSAGAGPEGSLAGATTRAFLVAAGLGALALPACLGTGAARTGGGRSSEGGRPVSARDIVRAPGVPAGMFASVAILAAVDIITAYLPVIGERRGIGPAVVGALLSLRAAASILSRLLIPVMVRSLGRVRLIAVSAAGSALAVAVLPVPDGAAALAAVLVVAGFFLGIGQPLTMSLIVQAVPDEARGTALAIRLFGNRVGQVATPAVAGLVAGAAGIGAAFWLLGGLLVAAAATVVRRPG